MDPGEKSAFLRVMTTVIAQPAGNSGKSTFGRHSQNGRQRSDGTFEITHVQEGTGQVCARDGQMGVGVRLLLFVGDERIPQTGLSAGVIPQPEKRGSGTSNAVGVGESGHSLIVGS